MHTNEDRNWELIGSLLAAESSGKTPRLFSSHRTLFGIPSTLDEELAKLGEADASSRKSDAATAPASDGPSDGPEPRSKSKPAPTTQGEQPGKATSPSPKRGIKRKRAPQRVTHPLAPVFDDHSRVLILGTMPSPKSRETGFYYNHPQNRFWKVMAALFDEPLPTTNEGKRALALAHGIALWDVLAECSIEGASDGSIAECVPNDIVWILGQAPIEAIFCTGAKATDLYRKYCEPSTRMPCTRLPSTSPANAAVSLEQLIGEYQAILPLARSEE